jgi:hypothetical protein
VEADAALGRVRLEVGRGIANGQSHLSPFVTFLFEAPTQKYKKRRPSMATGRIKALPASG